MPWSSCSSLAAACPDHLPSLISAQIRHHSDLGDYVRLALLAGALSTVGGALGSALESDTAVREAAYGYRPRDAARTGSSPPSSRRDGVGG